MTKFLSCSCVWALLALVGCGAGSGTDSESGTADSEPATADTGVNDPATIEAGKQIFRFDTFGNETHWTQTLRLHEIVDSEIQPVEALALGLKVDLDKLDFTKFVLKNPLFASGTRELLRQDAVVGLKATFDEKGRIATLGVTCALCHSTVDNALLPGIGHRLDGWPNRDLDVGAIIAMSAALTAEQKAVYKSWGKGKYDPRYNLDGRNGPVVIPPAYGLAGLNRVTFTGDGDNIAYWNRYVGVTQMGGHGTFTEPRTGVSVTNGSDDLISSKLPALQAYQLSLEAPRPPARIDAEAAQHGKVLFDGAARCATCHSGPKFTDANTRLHALAEVVSEPEPEGAPSYASRGATKQYRTSPLRGVWQHPPYFHNGTAPTLEAVVATYNTKKSLGLSQADIADIAEYLKSL
ncbi:hypothetical protein D6Z43_07390 [Pseudomonas sp. DY-1]|uniref:c-type cytochrome n=1 Tax=Pseudomonas sp. DY-1 TaxID=1755504 RepID=UPI000EA8A06D|nr:c-type cytochrome [Pseudomonas sp. DY-1]AYF86983.1 hypothetical protein D6Z43_07390 [Pseudomonas sp. DY-1]